MVKPDGADAAQFWTIERGDAEHTLRARFEVSATKRYVVGDIKIGGRPIQFGGQVAERVQVWISVWIQKGNHRSRPKPCDALTDAVRVEADIELGSCPAWTCSPVSPCAAGRDISLHARGEGRLTRRKLIQKLVVADRPLHEIEGCD